MYQHKEFNMSKELLIDCLSFEVSKDMINEVASKGGPFIVKGILQRANAKNQNGRVYPKNILEREAQKYQENFVKERRALGELDHPESQVVNLQNVSHNIVDMSWSGDDLIGTVEVLTTPSGNILRELFKSGIKLGISSRGMGSVKKNVRESADEVQDDFELIAFDFVSNPSTRGAFLYPDGQAPLQEGVVKNPITNKWEKTETIIRDILNNLN
jgi:Prohead core protein serine protease